MAAQPTNETHTSSSEPDPAAGSLDVGFIGLGDQGGAMAEMIMRGGFSLNVWARRSLSTEPFAERGAHVRRTPAELGHVCDVIGICVLGDADVEEVVLTRGLLDAMSSGSTLIVHSTVAPATCQRLAALAAKRGIHVLDAPVSGGRAGALRGVLSVMVGGDPGAFASVRPVLATFGNQVRRVGPVGTAQAIKVINNALFVANVGMAQAALDLGSQLGIERQLLSETLAASSGRSAGLDALPALTDTDWGRAAWSVLAKDVELADAVTRELAGPASPVVAAARSTLDQQRGTS